MTDGKVEVGLAVGVLFAGMLLGAWAAFYISLAALVVLGAYRMFNPAPASGAAAQKEKHLQAILELVRQKGEVSNADVRKALGVADSTAQRYFDELEVAGKLRQIGDTGRGVVYKLP